MNFILHELLLLILNMSITASIIIVFILIFRVVLKKAPKIFSYAVWGIVLFRLLCPATIETEFSLMGIFNLPANQNGSIEYIPQDIASKEFPSVQNPIVGALLNDNLIQGEKQLVDDPLQAIVSLATLIWIVGITSMLIYSLIQFVKLKKQLIVSTPLRDNIYLADHINSPFVIGIFKPKIYLPSSLSKNEQDYIIAHENHHIKRFDHITRILAFIALAIHWFNPIVWLSFVLSGKDMEMSCDEAVIKSMDSDVRADYSSSLLRFATGRKIFLATPLAFGYGDTKGRVKNVMKYKKPMVWVSIIALVVVGVIAVGFMSNPKDTINLIDAKSDILSEDTIDAIPSIVIIYNGENNTVPTKLIPDVKDFIKKIQIKKSEVSLSRIEGRESTHTIQLLSEGSYPIDINFNDDFSEVWVNDYVKTSSSYFVDTSMVEMLKFFDSEHKKLDESMSEDGIDKVQIILAGGNPAYGFESKIITDKAEILAFVETFDNLTVNNDIAIDIDIVPPSYYRLYDGEDLIEEFMFNGNDITTMWIGQDVKLVEYEGKNPFELYQESNAEEFIHYNNILFKATNFDLLGEICAEAYLNSFIGNDIPAQKRLESFEVTDVLITAGEQKSGVSWEEMKYQYVANITYNITTASKEYFVPSDGTAGKGTFEGLSRELSVKALGNDLYEIVNVGTGGAMQEFKLNENMETVSFEAVNISFPDEDNEYTVISDVVYNNTESDISGYKQGMLAFDKDGNPLELYWNGLDSSVEKSFYYTHETKVANIKSYQKTEPTGWSLFSLKDKGEEEYSKIKYVIYSFEEITFSDGRIWKNENYNNWLDTYNGKTVDINELDLYYPFVHDIEF